MKAPFSWANRSAANVREISVLLQPPSGRYFEPFCGAAALFFRWHTQLPGAVVLSDAHPGVITVLTAIRDYLPIVERARRGDAANEQYERIAEWLRITEAGDLRAHSRVLQRASIWQGDFAQLRPQAGDLVYCDPPFRFEPDAVFTPFSLDDHKRLVTTAQEWRAAGVNVAVSLAQTDVMRELYCDFEVTELRGELLARARKESSIGNHLGVS